MLPLTFAKEGEEIIVVKVGGNDAAKQHLADLGFVEGAVITVIASNNGNLIVNLKGTKLAITKEMAQKVMVRNA